MANKNAKKAAKKKAAARQAALIAKRSAERKAAEEAKAKRETEDREKRKKGNKTIIAAACAIAVIAAGMVFTDYQYKLHTTGEFRAMAQMTPVSAKAPGENTLVGNITDMANSVGATDIQFWAGSEKGTGPELLASITLADEAQTAVQTYRHNSLMLDSATGRIETLPLEEHVPGKEYVRLATRDLLHQYMNEDMEYQVLETADGILAMAGPDVDEYLADLAVIVEENPDATSNEQFELLKQLYGGKAPGVSNK